MTTQLLKLLHESYQTSLERSSNSMKILENLYDILDDPDLEVSETDAPVLDSFIDGLRGCIRFRQKTFEITNVVTYINITIMYIVFWLNEKYNTYIDINWYARRKSLESDLAKILRKSDSSLSVNIRDRFGIRGILLNNCQESVAEDYIYTIFEAITGIIATKNRKMRKQFTIWYENNPNIPIPDKYIIQYVLGIPFLVDFVKDFIQNPKDNNYQCLQFTLIIQMYSEILPGCMMEVQLRTKKMHDNAEHGTASHTEYKKYNNSSTPSPVSCFNISDSSNDEKISDFPPSDEYDGIDEIVEIDDEKENPINKVFIVDDFSRLHIDGFSSYESKEYDQDGIHFAKEFSDRRILPTTSLK